MRSAGGLWTGCAVIFLLVHTLPPAAAADPSQKSGDSDSAAARAHRVYLDAKERFQKDPTKVEAAWEFGRACFDRAEFAPSNTERAQIAEEGISACRQAISQNAHSAPAHYFLALNIGQLAQTKTLGALKLVEEMESELKRAVQLDPPFDFAGAHRSIGMLYRDAPGWPISIGSRKKAREHLQKAAELFPDFPENQLVLAESYLKWDEKKAARAAIEDAEKAFEASRKKLTGSQWKTSWADWEKRLQEAKAQLAEGQKGLASPRAPN